MKRGFALVGQPCKAMLAAGASLSSRTRAHAVHRAAHVQPAAAGLRCMSGSTTQSESWRALIESSHPRNNIPGSIRSKAGTNLLLQNGHPLCNLKQTIAGYFAAGSHDGQTKFQCFDKLAPVVTTKMNFDDLLTPADHVSRKPTDTFYCDDTRLLRCHMTAHQTTLLADGHSAFLMAGEVYRRDEVDATHYPIFHQIDGVRVWSPTELPAHVRGDAAATTAWVVADLKSSLEGLVQSIFGPGTVSRWVDAYFPFTEPSLELEVMYEGKWLEVLGCGQIRQGILDATGRPNGSVGWAFGLGVERLAMVLHKIPDIRLFWSSDPRFLSQFASAKPGQRPPVTFKPFSNQPVCYKDVAFWLPGSGNGKGSSAAATPAAASTDAVPAYHENDLAALVREVAGDLVESIARVDAFTHPKTGRTSHCYRILYRSMDKTMTNEEVDVIQEEVRRRLIKDLKVELR